MATTVKMHEAKTHLSSLVARALKGEEIVIARGGTPQVKLVPVAENALLKPKRIPGLLKGQISIPDGFFDPLPEDELRLWEGRGSCCSTRTRSSGGSPTTLC